MTINCLFAGLLKSYDDERTQSLSRHKNPYMIPVDQPLSYREQRTSNIELKFIHLVPI